MTRRTITLPDDLAAAVDALVAAGAARSVSRFFQDGARRHLMALEAERMAGQAELLDAEEETALARATRPARGRAPWGRLR